MALDYGGRAWTEAAVNQGAMGSWEKREVVSLQLWEQAHACRHLNCILLLFRAETEHTSAV